MADVPRIPCVRKTFSVRLPAGLIARIQRVVAGADELNQNEFAELAMTKAVEVAEAVQAKPDQGSVAGRLPSRRAG